MVSETTVERLEVHNHSTSESKIHAAEAEGIKLSFLLGDLWYETTIWGELARRFAKSDENFPDVHPFSAQMSLSFL